MPFAAEQSTANQQLVHNCALLSALMQFGNVNPPPRAGPASTAGQFTAKKSNFS
jgi:hypothetical protein